MTFVNAKRQAILVLAALGLFIAAGCEEKAKEKTNETTATTTQTAADTTTKEEPGVEKLIFAFQPQENPEGLQLNGKKLAEFMEKETGIKCEIFVPTSYAAVVEALRGNNAHVAYFSGWPYLIAHNTAGVELLVAEERDGKPFYYSQWYVAKDSPIKDLSELKGKNIAFTSQTSTSGYLFPLAKVVEEGHLKPKQDPKEFFGEVLFAGGYEAALKALVAGKVEAAAASDYAPGRYLSEEEQGKIRVLVKQGPAPTHGIAIKSDLPQEVKDKVKAALLKLNADENKELLKSIYGAEKLVERTHDEHVAALDKAQKAVGADYPLEKKKEAAAPEKKEGEEAPAK
ncbi:MAG: phosphate/phosphite/phosphonate ABC transporter substrate-binding protein [Myxococcota bacterium]|jgi:phosphonate transport system substrate-binding protein|nr:phosphate/phosphite/phosphonate ABC transporter substrate-binding protein [Myxococcota bacterium]